MNIEQQVFAILEKDDRSEQLKALAELRNQAPGKVLDALVSHLSNGVEKIRRSACSAVGLFDETQAKIFQMMHGVLAPSTPIDLRRLIEQKADAFATQLRENEDARVRLSCAIRLMSLRQPAADRAFLHALADPFEKIAQIACVEVGARRQTEGTAALRATLNHSSWRVRLEAGKALILQGTADHRVVTALEAMSQEPEAAVYDAECGDEELAGAVKELMSQVGVETLTAGSWGKLSTILAQARAVADRNR